MLVKIARAGVLFIIEVQYSGLHALGKADPHIGQFHVLSLLGVDIPATFAQAVMLLVAEVAEKLQVVDKIGSLVGFEGFEIVLLSFPWPALEVVV